MNPTIKASTRLAAILSSAACAAFLAAGCGGSAHSPGSSFEAWNVSVTNATPNPNLEVDLIGVSNLEKPEWEGYPVDKYWTPNDPWRTRANKLQAKWEHGTWTVDKKDPKWREWKQRGVRWVILVARLPADSQLKDTSKDPRRMFVSLDGWKGNTLKFEVNEVRIVPLMLPD